MRSHLLAAALAAAALTLVTACGPFSSGSASSTPPATAGSAGPAGVAGSAMASSAATGTSSAMAGGDVTTLRAAQTRAGAVLATSSGLTLYYYTVDRPGSGMSSCTGSCALSWPPLVAPVTLAAGVKLAGPVGQITRSDGLTQVTIDGYPIYRYSGDTAPGDVKGNNVGGEWHTVYVRSVQPPGGLMRVQDTRAGWVLANPHGMTVYYFLADQPGSGVSACTGGCARTWLPVVAPVRIPAGVKLAGPVGSIVRPDGIRQVTIDGYPIYRYIGDKAPGQVNGNNIGGQWRVVHIPVQSHY